MLGIPVEELLMESDSLPFAEGENLPGVKQADSQLQSPKTVSVKPAAVKAESLDTRILKILYAYFQEHPGDRKMGYNELVKISEAEPFDVIQCLYGLQEKKWAEFDLAEGAETGLVWLTQIGIRIAKDVHP
jgi:hypothetical protein